MIQVYDFICLSMYWLSLSPFVFVNQINSVRLSIRLSLYVHECYFCAPEMANSGQVVFVLSVILKFCHKLKPYKKLLDSECYRVWYITWVFLISDPMTLILEVFLSFSIFICMTILWSRLDHFGSLSLSRSLSLSLSIRYIFNLYIY